MLIKEKLKEHQEELKKKEKELDRTIYNYKSAYWNWNMEKCKDLINKIHRLVEDIPGVTDDMVKEDLMFLEKELDQKLKHTCNRLE